MNIDEHSDFYLAIGSMLFGSGVGSGYKYYLKNKYRTAILFFDRCLETGDSDVEVLLLKAYSHQKLQENSIAIDCCKKIQDLDPKNKSVFNLISELNS